MEVLLSYWRPLATAVVAGVTIQLIIGQLRRRRNSKLPLDHYEDGIVYIHTFPRQFTKKCVNLSPYAIKLETWCRIKNVPFQVVETSKFSPVGRQIPWVIYNGKIMGDSSVILETLKSTFGRHDELTNAQKGFERSISRMLDDGFSSIYFVYRYWDHVDEFKKYFRITTAPWFIRNYIVYRIGKSIKARSVNSGFGRYEESHGVELGKRDLLALEHILADKPFIFGDTPTAVDCAIFGHMTQIVYPDMTYPWKEYIRTDCPRLLDHTNRIRDQYWPDWDTLVHTDTFT